MPAQNILVVDDQPINVQLLKRKLEKEGLSVTAAYNGIEALDHVEKEKSDLILLDVMMPDMDGIEVCQRLQTQEDTRSIPVIFITARTSKERKLEGLGVGAGNYFTKPIDLDETLARVQTQLRFVSINREILGLQRRLVESRRAATIVAVTQGIAHNLNHLLGVVIGYLDLVKAYYDKPEQVNKNSAHVEEAVQRIISIVKQLSSLVVKTRPPHSKAGLQTLIEGGIQRFQNEFKLEADVTITNELGDLAIESNIETFEEVLSKTLINAWESYENQPTDPRPIWIKTTLVDNPVDGKMVQITIKDQGRGLDPEIQDHIFEPFISSKNTVGVGMGLTVARHALRAMGGEATMDNRESGGARYTLVHPFEKRASKAIQEDE
jgi:two-component system, sensor histidine kinase and response regulator